MSHPLTARAGSARIARGRGRASLLSALSLVVSTAGASAPGEGAAARLMLAFAEPPADAARFGQRFGLRLLRYHPSARLYVYEAHAGRDAVAVVARLAAEPAVAHVELDQSLHTENPP